MKTKNPKIKSSTVTSTNGKARTPRRKRVTFQVAAAPDIDVHIAGSFNDWNPEQHQLQPAEDGLYSLSILLPRGSHQYKFIIDGIWCVDPGCTDWAPNGMGSLNSVIEIL